MSACEVGSEVGSEVGCERTGSMDRWCGGEGGGRRIAVACTVEFTDGSGWDCEGDARAVAVSPEGLGGNEKVRAATEPVRGSCGLERPQPLSRVSSSLPHTFLLHSLHFLPGRWTRGVPVARSTRDLRHRHGRGGGRGRRREAPRGEHCDRQPRRLQVRSPVPACFSTPTTRSYRATNGCRGARLPPSARVSARARASAMPGSFRPFVCRSQVRDRQVLRRGERLEDRQGGRREGVECA